MFYFVKTPGWIKRLYKSAVWTIPGPDKIIYLTFDDGPHPRITSFVLDELKKYSAKATFFCIGKNVVKYPDTYKRILDEGHAAGNHSFDHLNGWKTKTETYVANVVITKKYIDSHLFRPPYGRITGSQQKKLSGKGYQFKMVMWSVLSGDFDLTISAQQCCKNVVNNATSGSIVIFHDSEKATERMSYALPLVLKYFSEKGYRFEKIQL